ncbi:fungal-specific transcription factor domain-containing protein [Mycena crocata]|nr:fungal-specific transcription factor domain-containing protein [Mycena crocata]
MDDQRLQELPNSKKRRVLRACDICRRRKTRCDSMNMADGRCSSCITLNAECKHTEPTRKRGPPKKRDVELEELKSQMSAMAAQLRQTVPSISGPVLPSADTSSAQYSVPSTGSSLATPPLEASTPDPPPYAEDDAGIDSLTEHLTAFSMDFAKNRFFGQSRLCLLARNATSAKDGLPVVPEWKRPEYWVTRPWELPIEEEPHYAFPDGDLIASLVELYFSNVHPTLPLLHRPTFERAVNEDLHSRDHLFGALLLAVLAVASRYSDDTRVFVPGANSTLSSGWIFFAQIEVISKSWRDIPSLYELQLYCLASLYVNGSSSPQDSWLYLGLGIRFIQDRGKHLRKRGDQPNIEGELWNRAFWCLLTLDITICAFIGRPSATHVEDFSADLLPLEVDDEYMEHPDQEKTFKQPPGKPSLLTYFVHHIRLCELLDSTMRRLYASDKTKKLMGWDSGEGEQRAVSNLDSAMNEFLDSLPDHLRWDPDRTGVFLDQSAMLHIMYYQLQIMIHRPYVHTTTLPFPSLAICTRAARSAINIIDVWLKRFRRVPLSPMQLAPVVFGAVLLLNIFGAKRIKLPIDMTKELAYVGTAMEALKFWETRYQTSGRSWELLKALRSRDDRPSIVPNGSNTPTRFDPQAKPYTEAVSSKRPAVQGNSNSDLSAFTLPTNEQKSSWNQTAMMNLTAGADLSIEQMLAATSQYDRTDAGSLTAPWGVMGEVSGTVGPAGVEDSDGPGFTSTNMNLMPMDEEVMSMWMAAPTNFRNLDEWDSYIGTENMLGFHWSPDFGAPGTDFGGPKD